MEKVYLLVIKVETNNLHGRKETTRRNDGDEDTKDNKVTSELDRDVVKE